MAQRHKEALAIQEGACNPIAIVNAILRAKEEIKKECGAQIAAPTEKITQDPAIRLMVHQLAHLCTVDSNVFNIDSWHRAIEHCKDRVANP